MAAFAGDKTFPRPTAVPNTEKKSVAPFRPDEIMGFPEALRKTRMGRPAPVPDVLSKSWPSTTTIARFQDESLRNKYLCDSRYTTDAKSVPPKYMPDAKKAITEKDSFLLVGDPKQDCSFLEKHVTEARALYLLKKSNEEKHATRARARYLLENPNEEEPEKEMMPLSDGQRWIPPFAPACAKGKDFSEKPQSKTPLTIGEACSVMMHWPPTVAKVAGMELDELFELEKDGIDLDWMELGWMEKALIECSGLVFVSPDAAANLQFRVQFFRPENQGHTSKYPVGPKEMEDLLKVEKIYDRMVELWPSLVGTEGMFWRYVYLTHGSNSEFPPGEYFKAGLDAATELFKGGHLPNFAPGEYTVQEVERAFKDIKADIFVVKIKEKYFLLQIRIQLGPAYNVCPGHGRIVQVLPADTLIVFP